MAKINIEYDTKEKTLVAKMDGKVLKNIAQIGIYNYKNYDGVDESHIELTSVQVDDENGLYERHCIYADHEEKTKVMKDHSKTIDIEKLSASLFKQLRVE